MVKSALLFILVLFGTANCIYAQGTANNQLPVSNSLSVMYKQPSKEQMRKQFEQRLDLTEKQKEKAKIIHKQGKEEIQPVLMQLQVKKQELEMVRLTKLSDKEQKERIDALNAEISGLEKQAKDIRKKNTQEFEKILNKNQKAELELMKAEGRARFEKTHSARPPFQGLGSPSFLFKPLLPPPSNGNGLWK